MMLDSTDDMMTGVFGDECTHHETRQGAFGRVDWFKKASRVDNSTADEWNSQDEKTEGSVSYGGRTGVTMVTPSNLPKKCIKRIQIMDFKEPLFSFNKKVNKNILFSTILVENGYYIWKVTSIGDTSIFHWTIFGGFGCLSNLLGNSTLRRLSDATDSSI